MKTKMLFLVYFFFTLWNYFYAQCGSGSIILTTQTQINNLFTVTFPGCNILSANLTISDDNDGIDNIVDLSPLGVLSEVHGFVFIVNNNSLLNLSGLGNLHSILGSINISNNELLDDVNSLNALDSIGINFTISNNNSLIHVSGITNLKYIGYNFRFSNNNAFTELAVFNTLHFIGGLLQISGNESLSKLNGFANLLKVNGDLNISNNNLLQEIYGFNNLDKTIGAIQILYNPALVHLSAFNGIRNLSDYVNISNNPLLIDIYGFNSLVFVDNLIVQNNIGLERIIGFNNLAKLNSFSLIHNRNLFSFSGLNKVDSIFLSASISNNGRLESLSDLISLSYVGTHFFIDHNDNLLSIDGLINLNSVMGTLNIFSNARMKNVNGLIGLRNIGDFYIQNNDSLENLDSLKYIDTIYSDLVISDNPSLGLCCAFFKVLKEDNIGGNIITYNNARGCNTPTEIMQYGSCTLEKYRIDDLTVPCENRKFSMSVTCLEPIDHISGFDMIMNYKKELVRPTGIIYVNSDLVDSTLIEKFLAIDSIQGKIYISLYIDDNDTMSTFFNGVGKVCTVEFEKLAHHNCIDSALFSINTFVESYFTGVLFKPVIPGYYRNPISFPSCMITYPLDSSIVNLTDSTFIIASASDLEDEISLVEFYVDNIKIGQDQDSVYSIYWNNLLPGLHRLVVIATDNQGQQGISKEILVLVNAPPVCNITSPTTNTVFFHPSLITIDAFVSDPDTGIVSKVEFFKDNIKIGEDLTFPFTFSLINELVGSRALRLKATDSFGAFSFSDYAQIIVKCVVEDLNDNGAVDVSDFIRILSIFGPPCVGCREDFNFDGIVDILDLLRLMSVYDTRCN